MGGRDEKGRFVKNHTGYKGWQGRKMSDELRQKLSIAHIKSPTKFWLGKKRYPETIEKMPKYTQGHTPWNRGTTGVMKPNKTSFKSGLVPWNKGKEWGDEFRKKMKEVILRGEKSPNWQGGKSFEPYGLDFNDVLKDQIRARDNYACQECHETQEQAGYKLPVHHIDYDKTNNTPENLITLCRACHAQTGFDRSDWVEYLKSKLKERCS